MPRDPFRSTPPLVIAHAGGEGLGPSNTILAMQRSMAAGADVLDADLWMTADNEDSAVYTAQAECPAATMITTTHRDVGEMRAAREGGGAWCAPAPIGQPPYREDRFSAEDVQWSHDDGMAIYTWTVDDPDTLRELAIAGVDGIYTRRPDVARLVFDSLTEAEQTDDD